MTRFVWLGLTDYLVMLFAIVLAPGIWPTYQNRAAVVKTSAVERQTPFMPFRSQRTRAPSRRCNSEGAPEAARRRRRVPNGRRIGGSALRCAARRVRNPRVCGLHSATDA